MARSLAARLGLANIDSSQPLALNDVVVRHLANRGRREDVYTRIRTIMREATFAPPPALRKLAEITDLNLYISTTFDSPAEEHGDAPDRARFHDHRSRGGKTRARVDAKRSRGNRPRPPRRGAGQLTALHSSR